MVEWSIDVLGPLTNRTALNSTDIPNRRFIHYHSPNDRCRSGHRRCSRYWCRLAWVNVQSAYFSGNSGGGNSGGGRNGSVCSNIGV